VTDHCNEFSGDQTSAGSKRALQSHALFDMHADDDCEHVHKMPKNTSLFDDIPLPDSSFCFFSGDNLRFTNDFASFEDHVHTKPKHASVLVPEFNDDALFLAFSGDKIPGSVASIDWDNIPSWKIAVSLDKPKDVPSFHSMQSNPSDWDSIEVAGRMMLRTRLDDIQRMCGQRFTLDATCSPSGYDKQFARSCANDTHVNSLGSFLSMSNLDGEHVWMNLLDTKASKYMEKYMELKQKHPTTVSGCFLVPYKPEAEWFKYFTHMQVLKEYNTGTSLFFTMDNGKRTYLPGIPGPFRVYYDPQDPAIGVANTKPKFLLNGRIFTAPGRILVDNGANTQYTGLQTVQRMGANLIQLKEQPKAVQVGDGRYANVVGACRVPVQIGAYKGFVTALVLDQFSSEFDLVLGESWLKAYKAQLNYGAQSAMRIRVANRSVLIRVGQRGPKQAHKFNALRATTYDEVVRNGRAPEDLLTTPTQLKRALKRSNGKYFITNVRYREPDLGSFNSVSAQTNARGQTEVFVTPDPTPFDHPLDTAGVYSAEPSSIKPLSGTTVVDEVKLQALLDQYKDVFPEGLPPGMPPERNIVHPIPLESDAKPSYRPMYRLSPEEKEECEKQVKDLLEKGLIQPSSSPWGAPVLFVPKPNGKLRMCCDFRMLNKQTIKNKYPLPRIDDLLDILHGKKVYSSLDLQSGYWQIALKPEDMQKTAFNTHFGHFEYKVMCFGLANAPASFQSLMNDIFKDYLGKFVVVYLDDILIFSDTPEQHLQHLQLVLQRLREHKLYAQLPKCDFGLSELKFLGHIIGADGVKPDPDKVKVVQAWPEPTNAAELRSFLGLAQYFCRFIQGYASIVHCLYDLMKPNAIFTFSEKHQKAFELVKSALACAPVLKTPDFSKPFELWTDASTHGIGSVLMQDGHPIAYESRKLSSAEFNYTTTEQELLAVVHSLKVFRPYIQSKFQTQIFTDHRALEWLLSKQDVSRREARWLEEISRYNLKLSYIPGRTNVADPVSRVPALMFINPGWLCALTRAQALRETEVAEAEQAATKLQQAVDSGEVIAASTDMPQETCLPGMTPQSQQREKEEIVEPTVAELLSHLTKFYTSDKWFSNSVNLSKNHIVQEPSGFYVRNAGKGKQLVIPDHVPLRTAIIREHHDPPYAGHRGVKATEHLVQRLYWWPGMQGDIVKFVTDCRDCQANKAPNQKPIGVAKAMTTPSRPWQKFSMDWMTDFKLSKDGYDSVLVVQDFLTKLVHFIPCKKSDTSEDVARRLRREVFRLHGVSEVIVSDRDPKLIANFMQDLFRCLGCRHAPTTAYRPQSDGQTERTNRVLQEMLRNYVSASHDDWDEYLDLAEFAYNNSYHEAIKTTPFRLTYGFDPRSPTASISLKVDNTVLNFNYIRPTLAQFCSMRSTAELPFNIPQKRRLARGKLLAVTSHDDDEDNTSRVAECPAARKFTSYMQQLLQHAKRCLDDAKQRQRAYAQKGLTGFVIPDWRLGLALYSQFEETPCGHTQAHAQICGTF
jgi:transposase InsO family protein